MLMLEDDQYAPGTIHDGTEYTSSIVLPTQSPKRKKSLRRGYSRFAVARRRFANVVIMLAIMVISGVATTAPAQAGWVDDAIDKFCPAAVEYNTAESNPLGLLNTQDSKNFNDAPHTAYEKYGFSGANFSYHYGDKDADEGSPLAREGDCFQFTKRFQAGVANLVFLAPKTVIAVGNAVYGAAFGVGENLEMRFIPLIVDVTKALKESFYLPFLTLALMLASIYLAWVGLVKRAYADWLSKFICMVTVMILGFFLMAQPQHVPEFAMKTVNLTTTFIQNSVSKVSSNSLDKDNICWLPPQFAGHTGSSTGSGGALVAGVPVSVPPYSNAERNIRVVQCNMWMVFILTPWTTGQFGVEYGSEALETPASPVKIGDRDVAGNLALRQLDAQSVDNSVTSAKADAIAAKATAWDGVKNEVAQTALVSTWKGESGWGRLGVAMLSLIGAVGAVLLLIVLSLDMLKAKFIFLTMLLFMPIFLLFGINPGWGKRQMLKYFSSLLAQVVRMVMAALMLGVIVLVFHAMLSSVSEDGSFVTTAIVMLVVSIGGLSYRKTLLDSADDFRFGGDSGGFQTPPALKKAGGLLAGVAGGLVGGTGGAVAAAKAGGTGAGVRAVAKSGVAGAQRGAYAPGVVSRALGGTRAGAGAARQEAGAARGKRSAREQAAEQKATAAAREADPAQYVKEQQETDRLIKEARQYEGDPTYAKKFEVKYGMSPQAYTEDHPLTSSEKREEQRAKEAREYEENKENPEYMERLQAKHGGKIPTYLSDEATRKRYAKKGTSTPRPKDRESDDASTSQKKAEQTETPAQQPKPSNFKPSGSARPYREKETDSTPRPQRSEQTAPSMKKTSAPSSSTHVKEATEPVPAPRDASESAPRTRPTMPTPQQSDRTRGGLPPRTQG